MARKRPKGVIALGWACLESTLTGRREHVPTAALYPENVVKRISFLAGGGHGWTLSALTTPREKPAPWKIVVITGAPSWAEYWAPALEALPADREMVVVDRPGFACSEPFDCIPDIKVQAEALMPVLDAAPGQKVLLVGQSYGAAIATLMAEAAPRKVSGVVLLSSYLSAMGPTAKWLVDTGLKVVSVIPRDLRNAVLEVSGQPGQIALMKDALTRLKLPVHVIHGDADDFAPIEAAEALVAETRTKAPMQFKRVPGANHFLNDGPADLVLSVLEDCIPTAKPAFRWPKGWSLPVPAYDFSKVRLKLPKMQPGGREPVTAS